MFATQRISFIIKLSSIFLLFFLCETINAQVTVNGTTTFNLCWDYPTVVSSETNFASDNVSKIVIARNGGILDAVDGISGKKLWTTETGFGTIAKVILKNKKVYVVSNKENQTKLSIITISLETGVILSNDQMQLQISNEMLNKLEPIIVNSVKNDRILEKLKSGDGITSTEFISENQIITGSLKGNVKLSFINTDFSDKTIVWKVKLGGQISSLSKFEEKILVTSFDNFAYMFSIKNGKEVWRKRLPGRILSRPLNNNDLLIFTVTGEKSAFIINKKDGKQVGKIELANNEYFIRGLFNTQNNYIFQTNSGLVSFSNNDCSKREKGGQ